MTRALREALAARGVGGRDGFRWRGGEISWLEGFSDAVFAFAVTFGCGGRAATGSREFLNPEPATV